MYKLFLFYVKLCRNLLYLPKNKVNIMKRNLLILSLSMLIFCGSKLNAQQETVKTSDDTLQYAAGAYIGQWLKANGMTVINHELIKSGINDMIAGKLSIKDSVLNAKLWQQIKNNQITSAQADEEQLFTKLKNQKGVGFLPSGIAYIIDSTGTGQKPGNKDSVEMELRGFFPSGQVFTDTYQSKKPLNINVSHLIPGLAEGVQLMNVGSGWRIFIPAALAYGSAGVPATSGGYLIPPYTALIYQVELKEVIKR